MTSGSTNTLEEVRRHFVIRLLRGKASKAGAIALIAIAVSILLGIFYPYSPYGFSSQINSPPSFSHLFGTDFLGRDLYSQIAWGSFPSLFIAFVASAGATIIGVFTGVIAGYYERVEGPLGGAADIVMTIPPLPLAIVLGELFLPTNLFIAAILISIEWPVINRAIRNQVKSTKSLQYVDSDRTAGLSNMEIILRTVIPEVFPIGFAYFILNLSTSIVITTALEFLGVGNPNIVSWGSIIYWAEQYAFVYGDWWWILIPGLYIGLISTSFALIGYSLEENLNPRLR